MNIKVKVDRRNQMICIKSSRKEGWVQYSGGYYTSYSIPELVALHMRNRRKEK